MSCMCKLFIANLPSQHSSWWSWCSRPPLLPASQYDLRIWAVNEWSSPFPELNSRFDETIIIGDLISKALTSKDLRWFRHSTCFAKPCTVTQDLDGCKLQLLLLLWAIRDKSFLWPLHNATCGLAAITTLSMRYEQCDLWVCVVFVVPCWISHQSTLLVFAVKRNLQKAFGHPQIFGVGSPLRRTIFPRPNSRSTANCDIWNSKTWETLHEFWWDSY